MLFKFMLCTETWESHPVGRNQKAYHLMVNLRFVIGFTMLKENTYRYSWHCKTILTRQQKADTYEIPQGSYFEWVSCAHYLAEIVSFLDFV